MPKANRLSQFERDLLESVRQAKTGEHARVHTPEQIQARRGTGWQARASDALREQHR